MTTYEPTDNFYNQKIYLTNIREFRFEFFREICRGKKVMHIGCADAMAFKPESNLHVYLSQTGDGTIMNGLDIDHKAIDDLAEVCPSRYYTAYYQVKDEYDIVLVPEVMEHVPNVELFLKDIFSIKSKEYLITVPSMKFSQLFCDDCFSLEMVHPDHKYWFSPYTLYNTLRPFSKGFEVQMYYLENKSQVGIRLWKKIDNEQEASV